MPRSLRRSLLRVGRWPRMCAAGICLLLALGSALGASRNPPRAPAGPTVAVVVAARILPAGHVLARPDLAVARWPPGLRPSGTVPDVRRLVGERLAGAVQVREAVTSGRLVGADLTTGLAAGSVAIPIALDDAHAADLVRTGDRVELLASPRPSDVPTNRPADSARVTVVATRLLVLAVLRSTDPVAPSGMGTEIVVAANRATALEIARHRSTQIFTLVLDSP
jgi:pilus assembly protein CpaB